MKLQKGFAKLFHLERALTPKISRERRMLIEPMEDRHLMAIIDLATLPPVQGSVVFDSNASSNVGRSVSSAGDVNGDGFDDVIVGDLAKGYLIFGSASPLSTFDLASLGSDGVTIFGPYYGMGYYENRYSVSGAGDINGDGFDDLILGAPEGGGYAYSNYPDSPGLSYVIFGRKSLPSTIDLSVPGTIGMTFGGARADYIGRSVHGGGDINGDGFDDLIIDADNYYGPGRAFVVFGAASLPSTIGLNSLGTRGVTIVGERYDDRTGASVRAVGDVNGDGLADLLVGAYDADGTGDTKPGVGESYLIFGSAALPSTIDIASLGSLGVRIYGVDAGDHSGVAVSGAGDLNGDGFEDLVVGADIADAQSNSKASAGESYVIFGRRLWPTSIDLATAGSASVTLFGAELGDNSGRSVSSAGDVNRDGYDDLLIGSPLASASANAKSGAGESYLIYGAASLPSIFDLANLGAAGITIFGADAGDSSGASVNNLGDVNGDGFDDFIIGAPSADGQNNQHSNAGESYILFGGLGNTSSVTHLGTDVAQTLTGSTGADTMVAGAANDTLLGKGGADVLIGGQGSDTIVVSDLSFRRVVGGNGVDTLKLDGAGMILDLTTIPDNRIQGIETIDLTGSGPNTLVHNRPEVANLSDNSNTLVVRGDAGDRVDYGISWTQAANQIIGGLTYLVFKQGLQTLKVQSVVTVNRAPVISGFGGTTAYKENGPAAVLDSDANVVDLDSANFDGGKLTVTITANSQATDRIRIKHTGNAPGQIGVSGATVKYGGATIGTFSGNPNFIVTLNAHATQAAVQALLRNISYETVSDSPSTLSRTVRVTLTDGDGATSNSPTKTVTVAATNDAPVIATLGASVSYSRTGPAILVFPAATLTDADSSDFSIGKLTVKTSNGQSTDLLAVRNQGTGAGQIGVSGSNVTYGGTVIGVMTGGGGQVALVITFNASASAIAVQALLRNITWRSTVASPSLSPRTVSVSLSDGDGGVSPLQQKTVNII